MTKYVQVGGKRALAYETAGDPGGSPVFLMHGTPGSRMGPRPRGLQLDLMGVWLISYDRPGYGESDRCRGRQVADAADDVRAVADALGIDRFAVLGRSGGGPHALACGARLADRVTSVAALVSPAPRFAEDLDWFAGMGEGNVREFAAAWQASDGDGADEDHRRVTSLLSRNTHALVHSAMDFLQTDLAEEMPDADRRVLSDPALRDLIIETYRHAVASTKNLEVVDPAEPPAADEQRVLVGWLDDVLAFGRRWGFEPEDIPVPVLLWHGEDDVFSPVSHSRWLDERIPRSTLVVEPGSAHFRAMLVVPAALQWLLEHTPRRQVR